MNSQKHTTYIREYFRLFMGLIAFLAGCLLVSQTASLQDYGLWFPAGLIILGGIMVGMGEPMGMVLGALLLFTGGSLLLHQLGIISIPYAGSVIGWLLVVVGGLIIISFSLKIVKKWRDKGPHEDDADDLDKVDY